MSNNNLTRGLPVLFAILAMAGCSTTATNSADITKISQLEAELKGKNTEVEALKSSITQLETSLASQCEQCGTGASGGVSDLFPPNANPGECYARIYIPPTFNTVTETVKVQEAGELSEMVPATYGWGEEEILVKDASERIKVVPATYEWVTEEVLVKPAGKKIVQVPAEYKTETEEVLIAPEQTIWKKGTGPITKVDQATGEIMCLVTIPAKYKTVTKKVLVSAATTSEVEIPAKYKTVKKQVLKTPPTTRKIPIPAVYKTIKVKKIVEPPKTNTVQIPARYEDVTKKVKVSDGGMEWRAILCETNTTPAMVSKIQSALAAEGYDVGGIDGVFGTKTVHAIEAYQADKGLPKGGVTITTLQALGVQ